MPLHHTTSLKIEFNDFLIKKDLNKLNIIKEITANYTKS
jgi:hypothetical protein